MRAALDQGAFGESTEVLELPTRRSFRDRPQVSVATSCIAVRSPIICPSPSLKSVPILMSTRPEQRSPEWRRCDVHPRQRISQM